MSELENKIGQLIMTGISGHELTREQKTLFRDYSFGGFILFSHNFCEPAQMVSLCRSLWKTEKEHPPFIAVDQEGGRVHRLPIPFTHFPAARLIGRTNNPDLAYTSGRATAAELALIGINLNFAPVLDLDSNPGNLVIGDRSFGSDPSGVIKMGMAWTRGLREGGIIPCVKHFPGHGDTDLDPHVNLPVVNRSVADLREQGLLPFAYACRRQIEALMTAHVVFRSLDSKFPATLSSKTLGGLLRGELEYGGVVFSDDLEMNAVSSSYSEEETATLGIHAGLDVLLFGHDPARAVRAFEFLCQEAKRNPLVRRRVEESYGRISELKRRYLRTFSGVPSHQVVRRLARLDHRSMAAAIQPEFSS